MPSVAVVKKDGRREMFNRDKVASGVYRAVEKRPIPLGDIEELVVQVEREVRSMGDSEVPTSKVGEMIMRRLEALDDVAYVRFASVYRSFTDVASFEAELKRLKAKDS